MFCLPKDLYSYFLLQGQGHWTFNCKSVLYSRQQDLSISWCHWSRLVLQADWYGCDQGLRTSTFFYLLSFTHTQRHEVARENIRLFRSMEITFATFRMLHVLTTNPLIHYALIPVSFAGLLHLCTHIVITQLCNQLFVINCVSSFHVFHVSLNCNICVLNLLLLAIVYM